MDVPGAREPDTPMYEELHITHIAGPVSLSLRRDEAVVLCVVRDGAAYVDEFIDHYLAMGFAHVAFMDNGSTDDTIDLARRHSRVTVLQSLASYQTEKLGMKHALMRVFGVGAWSLTADIDEFFQYPHMGSLSLKGLLAYLNRRRYTSVVSHMLDMVPDRTVGELIENRIDSITDCKWYFDTGNIRKKPYRVKTNTPANPAIELWYGGVRDAVFDVGDIYLTKHPLNFGDGRMILFNGHEFGNRRVADISGLLLHYKYLGDVYGHTQRAVAEKSYYNFSKEYKIYLEGFKSRPDSRFTSSGSVLYENHDTLLDRGLFTVTEGYLAWIREQAS